MATGKTAVELFEEGARAVEAGNYAVAFASLSEALARGLERTPLFDSTYAVCLAMQQKHAEAVRLCQAAISEEPCISGHYLQLGRIYLLADQRKEAVRIFREGMLYRRDQRIITELERLGVRRRPVFDDLPRAHLLNRIAGKIFCRRR
jgi:tetratricopeptide (TPR) repeat protein